MPWAAVYEVQSAEHEVALDEDQVKVELLLRRTETGSADKLTIGAGVIGGVGAVSPPPPPPPPQEAKKIKAVRADKNLYMCLNLIHIFIS